MEKKNDANISKAAWCGHRWGVRLQGRAGGTRLFHSLCPWKALRSPEGKLAGCSSYWFCQSFKGHGSPPWSAQNTATSVCIYRAAMPISGCVGFKLFFGHRIFSSNKTARGWPVLKTRSLLCLSGLWGQSSLNTPTHQPRFYPQPREVTWLASWTPAISCRDKTNYPTTLRLFSSL